MNYSSSQSNKSSSSPSKASSQANVEKYKPPKFGTYVQKKFPDEVKQKNASTQTYKKDTTKHQIYGRCEFWNRESNDRSGPWRK